jgi:uncharacterized membrane protein SpoIIM required for sporulation
LLASFIIIPMALLIQGEAVVMFWARYSVLWWVIVAQVLIAGLLIRTGVAYFNREDMLGRELDMINMGWAWLEFELALKGQAKSVVEWYRLEIMGSVRSLKIPIFVATISLGMGFVVGMKQAQVFVIPPEVLSFEHLKDGFIEGLDAIRFISAAGAGTVWLHNLRAIFIATLFGIFTFGILGILVLMLPMVIIGYITGNIAAAGLSPLTFLTALVLPHGVFEIPAMILAGAAILNLGASLTAPARGKTIGEAWLHALAKWAKVMVGLVLPLLLLAALIEVFVTPRIAVLIFGG